MIYLICPCLKLSTNFNFQEDFFEWHRLSKMVWKICIVAILAKGSLYKKAIKKDDNKVPSEFSSLADNFN